MIGRATFATALLFALVATAANGADTAQTAGDPGRGRIAAAKEGCAGCHDISGIGADPRTPRLCGQHEAYLLKQLNEFHRAARTGTTFGILGGRRVPTARHEISNLDAGTLADLAAHYATCACAGPSGPPAPRPEIANRCPVCHGKGGRGHLAGVPNLAGQNAVYLAQQMALFRAGTKAAGGTDAACRTHPMMECEAHLVSRQEAAALAAWYAGLPCR